MAMNNKGQVIIVRTMIFIAALILAIAVLPFLTSNITTVRGNTGLNCSLDDLTTGVSMTCLEVDLIIPIFFFVVVGAAGNLIYDRIRNPSG